MFCALLRRWPTDFPHRLYAICRACYPTWAGERLDGPACDQAMPCAEHGYYCPARHDGDVSE